MRSRGYAVFLALLLAVVATAGVYLYVKSVKDKESGVGTTIDVVVSTQTIPPGSQLDPLIAQNLFSLKAFPSDTLVQGAVIRIQDLQGRTTANTILAGEQISTTRLQGGQAKGGALGIADGFESVTISLGAPQGGGGFVQAGDHVTVYAEFSDFKVSFIPGSLDSFLRSPAEAPSKSLGSMVLTVVPDTRVLNVFGATTTTGPAGTTSEIQMTLELTPLDAQRVILAQSEADVWISLLPPNQEGEHQRPFLGGEILDPARPSRQAA
jgi:Flp pilus assembly protein CpaB